MKNKIKWLLFFLPVAVIFICFYIGHLLNIEKDKCHWYDIPWGASTVFLSFCSIIYSLSEIFENE